MYLAPNLIVPVPYRWQYAEGISSLHSQANFESDFKVSDLKTIQNNRSPYRPSNKDLSQKSLLQTQNNETTYLPDLLMGKSNSTFPIFDHFTITDSDFSKFYFKPNVHQMMETIQAFQNSNLTLYLKR